MTLSFLLSEATEFVNSISGPMLTVIICLIVGKIGRMGFRTVKRFSK